jgi:hypothetical protein
MTRVRRAIAPETLDYQERGVALMDRGDADGDAAVELAAFRARVVAAKRLVMPVPGGHCRDCWQRGRDAAVAAIEG